MNDEYNRERRMRRLAAKQGLALSKSRDGYGAPRYHVSEVQAPGGDWRSRSLISPEQGMSLDQVELFLSEVPE